MSEALPISALRGRPCDCVVGARLRFRPQLFWQEVLPQHAVASDLQYHADLATGRNYARLPCPTEYAADGALARASAVAVDEAEAALQDQTAVRAALREAATWDDAGALRHLLSSCYIAPSSLPEALCEAALQGRAEHVATLLRARCDPLAQPHGKSALHVAVEAGHEEVAAMLVEAEPRAIAAMAERSGMTPVELARELDMGPLARRLSALAQRRADQTED